MRSAEAHALLFEGLACCFIVFPPWLKSVRTVTAVVGEGLWRSWGRGSVAVRVWLSARMSTTR